MERGEGHYVFDESISTEREDYITDHLIRFNQANSKALPVEYVDPAPLQITLFDAEGAIAGGLVGRTHSIPQWLEITIIWIEEDLRGQGLGRQLMERTEQEGRRRGCRYARVTTSDFQAPEFYQKQGYALYGRLENCPQGETVFYFWKALD